jgi:hypothetical protein
MVAFEDSHVAVFVIGWLEPSDRMAVAVSATWSPTFRGCVHPLTTTVVTVTVTGAVGAVEVVLPPQAESIKSAR